MAGAACAMATVTTSATTTLRFAAAATAAETRIRRTRIGLVMETVLASHLSPLPSLHLIVVKKGFPSSLARAQIKFNNENESFVKTRLVIGATLEDSKK